MGKGRKRFTRDLLDDAKEIIKHYIMPTNKAQMERTLSLVGIVGTKPRINDVMPQIMERIDEEERLANIEMARRWARNGWPSNMIYDCMGESYEDYMDGAEEIDIWDKKTLKKLNKKLYKEKSSSKRGSRGKRNHKRYDNDVDYSYYDDLDDENQYEEYKCIKFYPDIENELSVIEFKNIKDFNDFCDKNNYVIGETDLENIKYLSVVHCCLDPIDKQWGQDVIITDKSYGGLYWMVADDLQDNTEPSTSDNHSQNKTL
jgi:hypothetical protein